MVHRRLAPGIGSTRLHEHSVPAAAIVERAEATGSANAACSCECSIVAEERPHTKDRLQ